MRQKVKISGEKVMELQDDICTILAKKFYLYHYKISKFSDCIIFEVDGYNKELSCVTKDIIEALQKEKEKIINKALILYEKTLLDPECSFLNTHELFSDGTSYSAFLTYYGFKSRKNYLKGVQVSSFDLQLYHLLALIDNALYDYQLLKKKNLLYEKSELFLKKVRKNPDISSDDLKKMGFNASYQKALKKFQNAKPDDEIVKIGAATAQISFSPEEGREKLVLMGYRYLDETDKGIILGEIRQMLRADKYKDTDFTL